MHVRREFGDLVAELDEDDPRELLDGQLVEIEVPTWTHERIVAALIAVLTQQKYNDAAVREFQRRSHLTVDGIVGPQTAAALKLKAV